MRFSVLSRKMIESGRWAPEEPHVIVSIYSPGDEPPIIPPNNFCKGITYVSFWDLMEAKGKYDQICTQQHAKQIVDFFKEKRILVDHVVCHCDAGVSRSAGAAAALSLIENGTDKYFFKAYHPNKLVYNLILKNYYNQESTNEQPTSDKQANENIGTARQDDQGTESQTGQGSGC